MQNVHNINVYYNHRLRNFKRQNKENVRLRLCCWGGGQHLFFKIRFNHYDLYSEFSLQLLCQVIGLLFEKLQIKQIF